MEQDSLHVRYLMVITLVLLAIMIGYNAFFVPDASMSTIRVTTDVSSVADETYTPRSATTTSAPIQSASSQSEGASKTVDGKININTATAQQLSDGLNGIGEVLAKRIVDYRTQNGIFKSIEAIKNVSGMGEKTFAKIKDNITI